MTDPTYQIWNTDCVAGMAEHLQPESVDLCVTSIPKRPAFMRENGKIGATTQRAGAVLEAPSGVAPNVRSIEMQHQSTSCPECGESFSPKRPNQRYCSQRCKWTYSNRTRPKKPNIFYDCVVCGKHVERWVAPSQQEGQAFRYCSLTCKGKDLSGPRHHAWKGGRNITSQGYIEVYAPDHPHAKTRGYVLEHRLVMEQMIGRYLDPEEVVHHEDDDGMNNGPSNLRLFANNTEHKAYEHAERQRDAAGRYLPLEESR